MILYLRKFSFANKSFASESNANDVTSYRRDQWLVRSLAHNISNNYTYFVSMSV